MPIYTKTGDDGDTGLFGNRRVPKDDPRIEAYGTVDELNACVGLIRAEPLPADVDERLAGIQSALFDIGADLATEDGNASVARLTTAITALEQWIDESESALPTLTSFVLPGGTRSAALLHLARTVTRRAERRYWTLRQSAPSVPAEIGVYLNRLSDLLFSWARLSNHDAGVQDTPWRRD